MVLCTCREDHILGDELVVNDRELWQLYSIDPGHSAISASPVKLNIICGVAICTGEKKAQIYGSVGLKEGTCNVFTSRKG